jgi:hypothetical protein
MAYEGIFKIISQLPYYQHISSAIGEPFSRILIFTFGLLVYGIVIWEFYSTLAKRDLFKINFKPYMSKWERVGEVISFFFRYTIAFPLYTFFWFIIFSIFLIVLSKSLNIQEIFFISIAMISFTRATAYYKEELANDVAKIIPLSFLALFLTDPTFLSFDLVLLRWEDFLSSFPGVLIYLAFAICLEWILRILYFLKVKTVGNKEE